MTILDSRKFNIQDEDADYLGAKFLGALRGACELMMNSVIGVITITKNNSKTGEIEDCSELIESGKDLFDELTSADYNSIVIFQFDDGYVVRISPVSEENVLINSILIKIKGDVGIIQLLPKKS